MSKTVDERIVSMQFDNKNFESNVKTSMSTLDKLKQALNFKNADASFKNIDASSKKINFSSMAGAIDSIGVKFSGLQVIAATALSNITNSVVNAGRNMVSQFAIQPITSGFQEYETQMKSIQTIMSNTRWEGTNLDQVNGALDELNTYADKTIYNFTEMTRNIGTFTAAGVKLDDSVSSIKGIANLAAVSGSTSQQASSAMYQLSQALAAGKVSLMDWNSVVNAGMGGKVFQDALIRTSELMGTGADQAIATYGSFRESLTQGQWLTTDVLNETLKQISGAYSKEELLAQGYTDAQADEILALADDATQAATKVRTFTQLIDTTMEAISSGWTNTWEILFGDFDEATDLFTNINNVISSAVQASADARNNLLQGWKDSGGRADLIEGLSNAFNALLSVITPIKEAFTEIFPPITVETLTNLTAKFKEFTAGLVLDEAAAANLKAVFKGVFSVIKMVGSVVSGAISGIMSFAQAASGGFGNLLEMAGSLGTFVSNIANAVTETNAFSAVLSTIGSAFGNVFSAITEFSSAGLSKLGSIFSGITSFFSALGSAVMNAVSNISAGLGNIMGTMDFGSILDTFNSTMLSGLILAVKHWFQSLTGTAQESTSGFIDSIKDAVSGVTEGVTGTLDAVRGSLQTWQQNIKANMLLKIAVAVAILAGSIAVLASLDPESLSSALGAITVLFAELVGTMTLFTKVNSKADQITGMGSMVAMAFAISILAGAIKKLEGLNADQIQNGVLAIAELATVMTVASKALSMGKGVSKGAIQLVIMAAAIRLLAGGVDDLGNLDTEVLVKGIAAIGALMIELVAFSKLIKTSGMISAAASIAILSVALGVLADTVAVFGSMSLNTIAQGLIGVGAAMVELSVFVRLLPKVTQMTAAALGMYAISRAVATLVPTLERMAAINPTAMATAVGGLGGALLSLIIFLKPLMKLDITKLGSISWTLPNVVGTLNTVADAMVKLGGMNLVSTVSSLAVLAVVFELLKRMIRELDSLDVGDIGSIAVAMPVLGNALNTIADAMVKLGNLSIEGAVASVISIVGAMKALSMGLDAVKGKAAEAVILTVLSVALIVFAGAIALIASVGLVGAAIAIVALAGALTVLIVAAKFAKPLIPTIYKLALSLVSFGAALAVLAVGSFAFGIAISVMVGSLAASILALSTLDPGKAATGLVILAAAFAAIYVAAKLLKPMLPSILSLAGSIIMLGLSCMAVSTGVAILIASLTALGSIGQEQAQTIIETLKTLVVGILNSVPEIATSLGSALKAILLTAIDVIVEVAPQLADGIFKVLMATMQSSLEYLPQMATFIIDFLIQMLNTVTPRLGELIPAISALIGGIITEIQNALAGWEASGNSIETGVEVLLGLSGLIVIFNRIKSMVPGAMKGAVMVGAFAVEVGAIIAALGAIQNGTGVSELINSGGVVLESLGTAIGKFIGGFVGGALEGLTSSLPDIATNLSTFMLNLTPFIVGAKMIDPSILDSIGALTGCIVALTGANILDAVSSFLTGGQDLGEFGQKLIPFGDSIVKFSQVVTGIDAEAVTAAATAGQALSTLASCLPKEGGLSAAIFGDSTDLGTFGAQLLQFGIALRMYSATVTGMEIDPIMASVEAGKALSDLAASLPKDGGMAAAIFGESTDLGTFGGQLKSFGEALRDYAGTVTDLNVGAITASVDAGRALSDLAGVLGKDDSLWGWLSGGNSMDFGEFGTQLQRFGSALVGYANTVAEINFDVISSSISRTRSIIQVIRSGLDLDVSGIENLQKMVDLAQAISDYYWKISGLDFGIISSSITNLEAMRNFISSLVGFDASGVSAFSTGVAQLGQVSLNELVSMFQNASLQDAGLNLMNTLTMGIQGGQAAVDDAVTTVITGIKTYISGMDVDFQNTGVRSIGAYAQGISGAWLVVVAAAGSIVNYAIRGLGDHWQTFYDTGVNLARGFANGIKDTAWMAEQEARAMADAAARAAQEALGEHSPSRVLARIGAYAGQGFANGFKPYVDVAGGLGGRLGHSAVEGVRMAVAAINTLDDDFTISPRIVPVVDTKAMTDSIGILNRGFNTSSAVVAQINGINSRIADTQMSRFPQIQNGGATGTNVTFNQYNTSPKALSSIDIYRQTRNQISRLKNGGLSS